MISKLSIPRDFIILEKYILFRNVCTANNITFTLLIGTILWLKELLLFLLVSFTG